MSTVQDKLKAIKALFGMEQPATPAAPPAEPAPAALGSYKLADGTEVSISELTVGGIVTIGDAPAPAGEHMLEDGTKIKLDDMGVIIEMEAPDMAPAAAPPAPAVPEELLQRMAAAEKQIGEFAAKFDAQAALITGLTEANKQLVELMEQFAAAPTGNPVEPTQQKFGKANAESKEERLAKITASLKALKK